jgi:hypothetical protein
MKMWAIQIISGKNPSGPKTSGYAIGMMLTWPPDATGCGR